VPEDNGTGSLEGGGLTMLVRSFGWLTVPAAFSMLSCGDAASPPPEGGAYITITNASSSGLGKGCPSAPHALKLSGATQPGPSDMGDVWVDGQDGHSVSCSVKGSGTYSVSGRLAGNGATFNINASVANGASGTASIFVLDPTVQMTMADTACTIKVDGSYKVEKGAVWANISCTNLTSGDDMNLICALSGTIVFRSCDH
jgi:hypothetical protein